MTQQPATPPTPDAPPPEGNEALMVWVKLALLLAGLAVFGAVIFYASRMLAEHHP